MTDHQWFREQYDAVVGEEPDEGATVEKSRDAVAHAYADAVEKDEQTRRKIDLVEEGRMWFDREVGPLRTSRRSSLKRDAEYIRDALTPGATMLGTDDPIFDQAYPLGNGSDKTLRYWTTADWMGSVQERTQKAKDATDAAEEFNEVAKVIVTAMTERGVTQTGRLFDPT